MFTRVRILENYLNYTVLRHIKCVLNIFTHLSSIEHSDKESWIGFPRKDIFPLKFLRTGVNISKGGDGDAPDIGDLERIVEFQRGILSTSVSI